MDFKDFLGLILIAVIAILGAGMLVIAAKIAWLLFLLAWTAL
jgi:hypothetical protein